MPELSDAIANLQRFTTGSLRDRLADIEGALIGSSATECGQHNMSFAALHETMSAAAAIKNVVGEINVVIHALGILLCLPNILETDELVQGLSLGAGNTGRPFDLETNKRIAEFKFIRWRGGPEAIRQNGCSKTFSTLRKHKQRKGVISMSSERGDRCNS